MESLCFDQPYIKNIPLVSVGFLHFYKPSIIWINLGGDVIRIIKGAKNIPKGQKT
jgi:hypothetical protein